jgi:hypothetical protein
LHPFVRQQQVFYTVSLFNRKRALSHTQPQPPRSVVYDYVAH